MLDAVNRVLVPAFCLGGATDSRAAMLAIMAKRPKTKIVAPAYDWGLINMVAFHGFVVQINERGRQRS